MSTLLDRLSGDFPITENTQRELERTKEDLRFKGILLIDNSYLGGFASNVLKDRSLKANAFAYEALAKLIAGSIEGRDICFPYEALEELEKYLISTKAENRTKKSTDRTRLVNALENIRGYMIKYPCEKYLSPKPHNLEPLTKFMRDLTSMPGIIRSRAEQYGSNPAFDEHLEHDGIIAAKVCAIALANPKRKIGVLARDEDIKRIGEEIVAARPYVAEIAEQYGFDDDPSVFSRVRFLYIPPTNIPTYKEVIPSWPRELFDLDDNRPKKSLEMAE